MFETEARGRARGWRLGRNLVAIFVVAVLFNYLWELAQAPLYEGMERLRIVWWHCFVASLGDGLLVVFIFSAGWAIWQRQDWFAQPGVAGYTVMLLAGLGIGISVEWIAVHVAGRWAYSAHMPLVPGLRIGMVPILQMLVLPPLIFRLVTIWHNRTRGGKHTRRTGI